MPILSYFAIVGSVLVALLFVADATLEKSGPLPFNNESVGLPKPRQPEPKGSVLTATLAPEPDMTSAAVRDATPPAPQAATPAAPQNAAMPAAAAAAKAEAVPERTVKAEADPERTAKVEPAPKKPKHVAARKPQRPDGSRRNYAWSRNSYDGFFGGSPMFGRF